MCANFANLGLRVVLLVIGLTFGSCFALHAEDKPEQSAIPLLSNATLFRSLARTAGTATVVSTARRTSICERFRSC